MSLEPWQWEGWPFCPSSVSLAVTKQLDKVLARNSRLWFSTAVKAAGMENRGHINEEQREINTLMLICLAD